jgi:hypothetical protein
MRRTLRATVTAYGPWLGLATAVFTGWYVCFLFPEHVVGVLSSLAGVAHEGLPVVPPITDVAIRAAVGVLLDLGLPVTVLAVVVGFGLFHRQAPTD